MTPGSDTLRVFFGAAVGAEARAAAAELARHLAAATGDRVRWVRPESYHVTLRFVGAVPAERTEALARAARGAVAPLAPFSVRFDTLGAFPSLRRPRVLVLGLAPAGPLSFLAARLEEAVVEAGFPPEERAFRAHLTLGRVRRGALVPQGALEPLPAPASFEVSEAVLYGSRPGPEGSVYTPLARAPLAGLGRSASDSPSATPGKGDVHGQERTHP